MKKVKKILVIIVTILTIFCIAQPVMYAEDLDSTYGIDISSYNPNDAKDPNIDINIVQKYVVPIYNLLQYFLIIAAVISIMIIGLKFIFGSVSEKAEYKQHLIPVVIGICLAAFLFTVIRILLSMAGIF